MANIDQYLAEIRSAIYGEEVRGSIINALEAQNNETESNTTAAEQALKDAQEAITNAQTAADTANTAAAGADDSGENAVKIATEAAENATQTASDAAAEAVEIAQTAADNATQTANYAAAEAVQIAQDAADSAENTANEAAENANTAASAANAAAMTQIASYDITYQASSIGTEPPDGEWIHSIPTVAEGNYLWTRVIIYSVSGDETTFYSVGKMGSSSGGSGAEFWYGQCETESNVTAKTVVCDGFVPDTGVQIAVKFQYSNTASNATMNINSSRDYPIYYNNSNIATGLLRESGTYLFVFDGSHYAVVGELSGSAINELQQDVAQINEDLSALDVYGLGTTINSNDDLNNYLTTGKYHCGGSSVARTLQNSPSTTGFTLYVVYITSAGVVYMQIILENNANSRIYLREYRDSAWTDWRAIVSTSDYSTAGTIIDQINTSLTELQGNVSTNTSNISQNASDISDLDKKVEQNTADIEENKTNIEQNASDITEINSALSDLNAFAYKGRLSSDTDPDDLINQSDIGFYYVGGRAIVTSTAMYGFLLNFSMSSMTYQIFMPSTTNIYCRYYAGNPASWQAWRSISTTAVSTTSTQSTDDPDDKVEAGLTDEIEP